MKNLSVLYASIPIQNRVPFLSFVVMLNMNSPSDTVKFFIDSYIWYGCVHPFGALCMYVFCS